jgi:hypothetical protein
MLPYAPNNLVVLECKESISASLDNVECLEIMVAQVLMYIWNNVNLVHRLLGHDL